MESICFNCENLLTYKKGDVKRVLCILGINYPSGIQECTHFKAKPKDNKVTRTEQTKKTLKGKGKDIPKGEGEPKGGQE